MTFCPAPHRTPAIPRSLFAAALALLFFATHSAPLKAQNAAAQLTLTADRATAYSMQMVYVSASVSGGLGTPTGSITFLDNGKLIAATPLDSRGIAALNIASFQAGNHLLSATYTGDKTYAASTSSATLSLAVLPLPVTISAAPPAGTIRAATPLTVRLLGLPAAATGTVVFTNGQQILASSSITGQSTAPYIALGDSVTSGDGVAPAAAYPALFAASLSLTLSNRAIPGYIACDILPEEILTNDIGSTQTWNPLYSLMIGGNDAFRGADPVYEAFFRSCHQAALAFLGTPREYKVLAGDPAATIISGPWRYTGSLTDGTWRTLFNSTGSGSARFQLTTAGQPLYLWYLVQNGVEGSFSVAVDGVPNGPAVETQIYENGLFGAGYGLLRVPTLAGPHTIDITALSGQVGILGVGTPPSPGAASTHPTVIVTDLPSASPYPGGLTPDEVAAYTADIAADVALLTPDGLDLRYVATQPYMSGDFANFQDYGHPTVLGHQLLAKAVASITPSLSVPSFVSFQNTVPSASISFPAAGTQLLQTGYLGDAHFNTAQSTPVPLTVVLAQSSTALSVSAASILANTPLALTATVTPDTASGSVTFADGTTPLQTVLLTAGAAAFSTATLNPGPHSLSVTYSGDGTYAPSASPAVAVQIALAQPTVSWAPVPAGGPYGSLQSVTAAITPAAATGNLVIQDSFIAAGQPGPTTLALGSAALHSGLATLMLPALGVGQHSLTALYAGDTDDTAAAGPVATFTVTALPTSITLSSPLPKIPFGTTAILTAGLTPAVSTSTITFTDALTGLTTSAALRNGTASISLPNLTPGLHPFTAGFAGDTTHAASLSLPLQLEVDPLTSSITLTAPPAIIAAGSPLLLSVTVTPSTATGQVIFRDQALGILGQAAVVNGIAALTLPHPAVAPYTVTATYGGDSEDNPASSAPVTFAVTLRTTSLNLTTPTSNIIAGTPILLTAALAPSTATGSIVIADSLTGTLATLPISPGTPAALTLPSLPAGTHTLLATYAGDSLDQPSTSSPLTLTVAAAATATTLMLAQSNIPFGSPATVNLRLSTAPNLTPTGTLTLRTGSTTLASTPVQSTNPGTAFATLPLDTTSFLPGTYPLTAAYSGDPNDAPSTASATLTVTAIPVAATLTLSATQVPPATPVTVTVQLQSTTVQPLTGTVTYLLNGTPLQTVAAAPQTTISLPAQALGTYTLTANFTSTGPFAPAITSPATLTVTSPLTLAFASSSLTAAPGSRVSTSVIYTPLSGFSGTVTTTCVTPGTYLTCTMNAPGSLTGPVTVPLTITVATSDTPAVTSLPASTLLATLLVLPLVRRRRRGQALLLFLISFALLGTLTACASHSSGDALPPGAQNITVTATAAGVRVSSALTLTIQQ